MILLHYVVKTKSKSMESIAMYFACTQGMVEIPGKMYFKLTYKVHQIVYWILDTQNMFVAFNFMDK